MNIPVSTTTDILVFGGSTPALEIAFEARESGSNVYVVTPYSYMGDNICATMNFWEEPVPMFADLFLDWPEKLPTPTNIKCTLEHKMINAGIHFLYESHVLRLLTDDEGRYSGALIGNRSGLQIIKAKLIIDGTERALAARMTAMPFTQFVPGKKLFERIVLSEKLMDDAGEQMPVPFILDDKILYGIKYSAELDMQGTGPADFAAAELEMRRLSWNSEHLEAADKCSCQLEDMPCGTDPDGFVYTPEQISGKDAAGIAASRSNGEISAIAEIQDNSQETMSAQCSFDPNFRFNGFEHISFDDTNWPILATCDTAVAGGGTGGAPAGIGAARSGSEAMIIEGKAYLGGVGTEGRIASYWFGNVSGFTTEVDAGVAALGGAVGDGHSWKIECKQQYWQNAAEEAGCKVWFNSMVVAVVVESGKVQALLCATPYGAGLVRVKNVVDASGNADVAASAGAPVESGNYGEPALQGTGLPPVNPGSSYLNTDYTFCLDSDVFDTTRAFITARDLFADKFDTGRLVDTRERRRIIGELSLTPMDFYLNRTYNDTINIARSNFDTHGFTVHPLFAVRPPHEKPLNARVPLRTMLPLEIDNVIVTGLGISSHRDALPVVRMQPDVQNQGFAAGIAAAMAVKEGIIFRDLDVKKLQKNLVELDLLPEGELAKVDGFADYTVDPVALVFAEPEKRLPELIAEYDKKPSLEKAMILAFLKDDIGKKELQKYLDGATWDEGWAYTGMHQFGASCSKLDAVIMALANIASSEDSKAVIDLCNQLTEEHRFSHFRSCSLFFMANPSSDAIPSLERLLTLPEMTGWDINDHATLIKRSLSDVIDTAERNHQLKEIYIASALIKCDPTSTIAKKSLSAYANGLHGLFAKHARSLV